MSLCCRVRGFKGSRMQGVKGSRDRGFKDLVKIEENII